MKQLIPRILLFCVFSFCLLMGTYAECTKAATVKYMQQDGWSRTYRVDVSFMTGYELIQATNTMNYNVNSVYAIIFWGQSQASVIELSSLLLCGSEVSCSCINSVIYDLQGKDQDGDKWNICLGTYCL